MPETKVMHVGKPVKEHVDGRVRYQVRITYSDGSTRNQNRVSLDRANQLYAELYDQIPRAISTKLPPMSMESFWPTALEELARKAMACEDPLERKRFESQLRALSGAASASARYVSLSKLVEKIDRLENAYADIDARRKADGSLG